MRRAGKDLVREGRAEPIERFLPPADQAAYLPTLADLHKEYAAKGATGAGAVEESVAKLARPRAAWVMLPSGEIT